MVNGRKAEPAMPREGKCPMGVKFLLWGSINGHVWPAESTVRIRIGYLVASGRGIRGDASVIRIFGVQRVGRRWVR